MQQNFFQPRNKRKQGWFWMDNDYLNGYAKIFGTVGTAIYASLVRHADNNNQQCFPSQELIAEEHDISTQIIREYVDLFEKCQILQATRERDGKTKRWKPIIYDLIDKEFWKSKEETKQIVEKYRLLKRERLDKYKNHPNSVVVEATQTGTTEPPKQEQPSHPNTVGNKEDPVKETQLRKTQCGNSLVDYFYELKGWTYKKEEQAVYRRFLRPAKELLNLCEGNLEEAKLCLKKVADWASSRELDWSIETVFKKWYDLDILKPKEKKPYYKGNRVFEMAGKVYVLMANGEKLEFAGSENEIEYK